MRWLGIGVVLCVRLVLYSESVFVRGCVMGILGVVCVLVDCGEDKIV